MRASVVLLFESVLGVPGCKELEDVCLDGGKRMCRVGAGGLASFVDGGMLLRCRRGSRVWESSGQLVCEEG